MNFSLMLHICICYNEAFTYSQLHTGFIVFDIGMDGAFLFHAMNVLGINMFFCHQEAITEFVLVLI
jgi:hypothetical protein